MASIPAVSLSALFLGLSVVFALFHFSAVALGSDRGQWGVAIAVIVVGASVIYERVVLAPARSPVVAAFKPPASRGIWAAVVVSLALIAVPIIAATAGVWLIQLEDGLLGTAVGIFAQAGIAEETLFRSFLYGHLREGRSFSRAAWLSLAPFAAVHLILFWTMPWPVAAAALALSCVTSFPLAWLWELGGRTVWAPAILHAVIQGVVKVITVSGPDPMTFPLLWMAACALLPLLVLAIPPNPRTREPENPRT